METIFTNTENSKTNEPHIFRLSLVDKLNLKNPNQNIALGNLKVYYTMKTLNQHTTTINLKFLLLLGMILVICLMVIILLKTFKTSFNLSLKILM